MVGRFGVSGEWREGQWSPQQKLLASVWKFSEPQPLLPQQLNGCHAALCSAALPDRSQPCRLQAHLFLSLWPSLAPQFIVCCRPCDRPLSMPSLYSRKGLLFFMGKLG